MWPLCDLHDTRACEVWTDYTRCLSFDWRITRSGIPCPGSQKMPKAWFWAENLAGVPFFIVLLQESSRGFLFQWRVVMRGLRLISSDNMFQYVPRSHYRSPHGYPPVQVLGNAALRYCIPVKLLVRPSNFGEMWTRRGWDTYQLMNREVWIIFNSCGNSVNVDRR